MSPSSSMSGYMALDMLRKTHTPVSVCMVSLWDCPMQWLLRPSWKIYTGKYEKQGVIGEVVSVDSVALND